MNHTLPTLPYNLDDLAPYISKETLEYHYGKHHAGYVKNLNNLIENTKFAQMSLEEIITSAPKGGLYNNAAQVWNHTFYFLGLSASHNTSPSGKIKDAIEKDFGSFEAFQEAFNSQATTNFGSGWTWLAQDEATQKLEIINTDDAECILNIDGKKALLVCDVWEHAYYIDTRNDRGAYLKNFWNIIDWKVVNNRFS